MIGPAYNMPQIAVPSCVEACRRRIIQNLSALHVIGMCGVSPLGASFSDLLISYSPFCFSVLSVSTYPFCARSMIYNVSPTLTDLRSQDTLYVDFILCLGFRSQFLIAESTAGVSFLSLDIPRRRASGAVSSSLSRVSLLLPFTGMLHIHRRPYEVEVQVCPCS